MDGGFWNCLGGHWARMIQKRVHNLVWALILVVSALMPISHAAKAQSLAQVPGVTAQSVYVFDATANLELMASGPAERRAPASTIKIITAMVVVDNADLSAQVVVDAQDVTDPTTGESTMT